MTDTELAFLRSICNHREDDGVRLAFADWLDERDTDEGRARAEFVRVQCELPTLPKCPAWPSDPHNVNPDRYCELRRRERELLKQATKFLPEIGLKKFLIGWMPQSGSGVIDAHFTRGFISHITLSWSNWLSVEKVIYWGTSKCERTMCRIRARINELMSGEPFGDGIGPGNTAKRMESEIGELLDPDVVHAIWRQGKPWGDPADTSCPACHGSGEVPVSDECPDCNGEPIGACNFGNGVVYPKCSRCSGNGRIPRPFPPTAQPLEEVTLTTWPDGQAGRIANVALTLRWPKLKFNLPATDAATAR